MSFVINTNVMSLVAQQNLNQSQNMLNQAIERLSSGKKINSAKDDAAGLAIANRMTAQIRGLSQARSNASDGISLAQTTEGALDQINSNLQRIRELSVQAANGTNSDSDLASIQDEIDQRLAEIDRVSAQTTFNGVSVLAEDQSLTIQVGDNDDETISIQLSKINQHTLGLSALDMSNQITSADLTAVGGNLSDAVAPTTTTITYGGGASVAGLDLKVADDGTLYADDGAGSTYTATFNASAGTVTVDTGAVLSTAPADTNGTTNDDTFVDANGNVVETAIASAATWVDSAGAASYDIYRNISAGTLVVSDGTNTWTMGANSNAIDLNSGLVTLNQKDATAVAVSGALYSAATTGNVLTTPGTAAVAVDLSAVNSTLSGTNTLFEDANGNYFIKNVMTAGGEATYYSATADATTGAITRGAEVVVDPLAALDDALAQVDQLRSGLGAMQNRFDSAITNLSTTTVNLKAARSRIVDANYAKVVSQMSKAQILQQAGTSVLAQANASQQSVLSLLR